MRKYEFKLVIHEGCDEFWEELKDTGCDEVLKFVKDALAEAALYVGDNCELNLVKYTDERND